MPRFGEAPGFTADDRANLEAILADTGTTLDAALAVVDANVDAILVDTGTTLDTLLRDIFALSDTPRFYTYPAAAAGISVVSTATEWGFGAWTEIVPADTIAESFWAWGLNSDASISPRAIIEVAAGAAGSEVIIGQIGAEGASANYGAGWRFPLPRKTSANTRISARMATSGVSATTTRIRLMYCTGL